MGPWHRKDAAQGLRLATAPPHFPRRAISIYEAMRFPNLYFLCPRPDSARLVSDPWPIQEDIFVNAHYHAVIWIDHHEAHVIHFNADQSDADIVRATHSPRHLHSKAGSPSGTRVRDEPEFFRELAAAVGTVQEILIAGPSSAKTEFVKYLHKHEPVTFERISGIETMDRVSDKSLVAEARRYFASADRMHSQRGR